MDADGDTGPGRHTLEILRTSPNGQPRHGATTSPGQPSADQQKGQADTDASPPLRLPGSFDAFYQEEYSGLVQLAFVLSGSRYGAEDIAQDALVAAWKKWPELEQPLAWTRRVVANLAASAIRRRMAEGRAMVRLAIDRREPIAELEAPDTEFWAAVRKLPTRQRQMLALYYLWVMSTARWLLVTNSRASSGPTRSPLPPSSAGQSAVHGGTRKLTSPR